LNDKGTDEIPNNELKKTMTKRSPKLKRTTYKHLNEFREYTNKQQNELKENSNKWLTEIRKTVKEKFNKDIEVLKEINLRSWK
jgi:DNA anti-recombination protein RmuC